MIKRNWMFIIIISMLMFALSVNAMADYDEETCDHDWSEWTYNRSSGDCTADDGFYRYCYDCDARETKRGEHEVDEYEENYGAYDCLVDGLIGYCENCDLKVTKGCKSHLMEDAEWKVSKNATFEETGEKCLECERCLYEITEIVESPSLLHNGENVTEIIPEVLNRDLTDDETDNLYRLEVPAYVDWLVIPVEVKASGYVRFWIGEDDNWSICDDTYLYADKKCREPLYSDLLNKGTYYILVEPSEIEEGIKIDFHVGIYSKSNRTIKSGNWYYYSGSPYMKINVPSRGFISVTGEDDSKITLYDKDKNKFSENAMRIYYGEKKTTKFAVKKGTYYLKCSAKYDSGFCKVKYTFKAYDRVKQNTMDNAVALKKGSSKNIVFYSDDSEKYFVKYFKLKFDKKQRIEFEISSNCKYEVVDSNNKKIEGDYVSNSNGTRTWYSNKKLAKGNYYIRIKASYTYAQSKKTTGDVYKIKRL